MTKRDIFAEARKRVPLEKLPVPKPMPQDPPTAPEKTWPAGRWGAAAVISDHVLHGTTPPVGSYMASLERCLKAAKQLHEKKGYYYRKWRRAMRQAFAPRRRKGD